MVVALIFVIDKVRKHTVSENDVGHSQKAFSEADVGRGLVHDRAFAFNTHSDHGDNNSDKYTQECCAYVRSKIRK